MKKSNSLLILLFFVSQLIAEQRNYISGNKFRDLADYRIDSNRCQFDPALVPAKSIVYCDVCYLHYFFSTVFPRFVEPFILITHNGDSPAPGIYKDYLEDPRIIIWFGQNCDIEAHSKFYPIPIGLANHPKWAHGDPSVFDEVLDHLVVDNDMQKSLQLYINIALTVSSRNEVYSVFENKSFVDFGGLCQDNSRKPIREFLLEMAGYTFILSPFGGGLDCHRTWEALLVGSIPVVKTSTLDPLYDDLPVIIVQDWNEITLEYLMSRYETMKSKVYNYDKLFMDYWVDLIKNFQQSL